MHFELYKNKIEPDEYLLNLIYSDIFGFYIQTYSRYKYYVIFLDNYDKTSEVILLLSKDGVLANFYLFQNKSSMEKNSSDRFEPRTMENMFLICFEMNFTIIKFDRISQSLMTCK